VILAAVSVFVSVHGIPGFQLDQIIPITVPVPELFMTIFNQHWVEQVRDDCSDELLDLKLEVLHMVGAFFSSSKVRIQRQMGH